MGKVEGLVLSLFPGIGILDSAFEAEGFCIVRGPDLLWGGEIKRFHARPGWFWGVIGGPPCQRFSQLAGLILKAHGKLAEDLIPEFLRVVREAQPAWFMMENVRRAPAAALDGYQVHAPLFDNRWLGGIQSRVHRFSFGTRDGRRLNTAPFERVLEHIDWQPRVMARGLYSPACHAKGKRTKRRRMAAQGCRSHHAFVEAIKLQGLPAGWDLPGFKLKEKFRAVGNAVPYPMALALAKAVKLALTDPVESLAANA